MKNCIVCLAESWTQCGRGGRGDQWSKTCRRGEGPEVASYCELSRRNTPTMGMALEGGESEELNADRGRGG